MTAVNHNPLRYVIFPTDFGAFGLAGIGDKLLRTHLACPDEDKVARGLPAGLGDAEFDRLFMPELQKRIKAYYKGTYAGDFADVKVDLSGRSDFARAVLAACRKIKPGRTMSYSELARLAGYPNAARAVGTVLARNRLPLIIPCHRVIRAAGRIGNFSADTSENTKKRMLQLEKANI